jgi:hypothetical protein
MAFNSKASWDGEKLVLTYRRAQTGSGSSAAPETKQVLSLESSGRLVIEYTTPGDGGKVDSGKLIFRKGSQKS